MRCPWISVKSRNSERLLGWRNLQRITTRSLFAQWRRHQSTIGWYQLFYLVFTPCAISKFTTAIYAYLCFQYFSKQFTDDYLSNHLHGQEARKVFIQHPRYNIEVLLKRTKVGRAIIHSHWPKVARTFNITEGSTFAFRFCNFLDEIHLSIYHVWCYFPKVFDVACETWCCCVMA